MAYQLFSPRRSSWKAADQTPLKPRLVSGQPRSEELVNCWTHGLGLVLSVAGLALLVGLAAAYGSRWHVVGCSIYGSSLVLVYAASTLYHGADSPAYKPLFRQLDEAGVYLLIAGTYTPFTLVPLHGGWGWAWFSLVWGVAMTAIGAKLVYRRRANGAPLPLYLGLGWLGLIAIIPLLNVMPGSGIGWLVAGGVVYTLGTLFLVCRPFPFSHGIWHIAVLLGSACHFLAVLLYVIPRP